MYYVTKCFEFEAAHYLNNYSGKCAKVHGHSYKVEITCKSKQLDEIGMVIDFKDLKERIDTFLDGEYDHSIINDIPPYSYEEINPTAENMARIIFLRAKIVIDAWRTNSDYPVPDIHLHKVRVWETSTSYAEYVEESEEDVKS